MERDTDLVGAGTWQVVASAPDPAGNVGSAKQTLTIGARRAPPRRRSRSGPAGGAPSLPRRAATTALTAAAAETAVAPSGTRKLRRAALWIGTKVTAPAAGRVIATATAR